MNHNGLWLQKNKIIKKIWINQVAFSLFGLFVASALSGSLCIAAGVFSLLFYLSVVGFAVVDDAQKDRIIKNAGRGDGLTPHTGLRYMLLAFLPSFLIIGVYSVYTFFASEVAGAFRTVYFFIVKYVLAGEILGIDVGLTNYTYNTVTKLRESTASPAVLFLSDHAFFQLIFLVLAALLLALLYRLAFCGVISFNTTDSKKKDA